MTQSPMYLSIVPLLARIRLVSLLNTPVNKACNCVGSICSDIFVKPRISQNITVSSRLVAFMV